MYFFLFQHFYVWANIPIKASLCLTIIRIASDIRWIRWTLHTIICLLVIASLITNIYLLTDCKPFVANWDKTVAGAQCRPAEGTVALGYAYSAINIIIDWTVALLPIFLLWRIQMRWAQKLPVMVVLALGVFASTATLVRLRTLTNFTNVSDYLCKPSTLIKCNFQGLTHTQLDLAPLYCGQSLSSPWRSLRDLSSPIGLYSGVSLAAPKVPALNSILPMMCICGPSAPRKADATAPEAPPAN